MVKIKIRVVCLWILFIVSDLCYGQKKTPLYFKHLNSQSGLSDPNIRYLATDHLGFLWIGTFNGLNRFDGKNCVTFFGNPDDPHSLKGNVVSKILRSNDKNLWFGTSQGLSFYNYEKDTFTYYQFPEINMGQYYYASPFFVAADSSIWSNMAGGIYVVKDKKAKDITFETSGKTYVNEQWKDEIPWILTPSSSKGVFIHYVSGTEISKTVSYFEQSPALKISDIYIASDSLAWLASEAGLIRLNPHNGQYKLYPTSVSLNSVVAYKNRLYLGSNGEGLMVFDLFYDKFVQSYRHDPSNPASISGNNVDKICIDKKGNLFINIVGEGLDYASLNPPLFDHVLDISEAHKIGFDNTISALVQLPNGEIWCGSKHSGILVYDSNFSKIQARHFENTGINQILSVGQEGLLLELKGYKHVFYSFKTLKFSSVEHPSISLGISSLSQDSLGYVLSTPFGLSRLKLKGNSYSIKLLDKLNSSLEWHNVNQFAYFSEEEAILQTYSTNLYYLRRNLDGFDVVKEIARTPYNILKVKKVGELLFLATTEGLHTFNTVTKELSSTPLFRAYCTDILHIDNGTLWINTHTGLYNLDIKTGATTLFSRFDGIQGTVFNSGALLRLNQGEILAGGSNGVNRFSYDNLKRINRRISAYITQLEINDLPYRDNNPILIKELNLDYKSNTITFQVSPLDFQNSSEQQIYYQMVGYDKEPVEASGVFEVRYAQMPPGDYIFEVHIKGDEAPRRVMVHIKPPFWMRTWFLLLAVFSALGLTVFLTYMFGRWVKNNQLEKLRIMLHSQEEERKRIAIDLHDDLGGRLSSLKLYMLATVKELSGKPKELVRDTTKMLDEAIVELRNILFNLSPKSLDENGLEAALEDLSENIERITMLSVETNIQTQGVEISRQIQYAVYRICQELINNTLKHAKATEILISLIRRNDGLILLYEDNGVGFDEESVKKGYGLTNIRTHAQAIFSELIVDSSTGRGTAVTLTVPPEVLNFEPKSNKNNEN